MDTNALQTARIRAANNRPPNPKGKYVLYWVQMVRRLHSNHAFDHALRLAVEYKKPLVVYEALKLNYPWASARHHAFVLQGMRDNAAAAKKLGVSYWPFVETPDDSGHGLVKKLTEDAVCVVSDDYPAFICPAHNRALAAKCSVPFILVDGNSIVPLSRLGAPVAAAAHLRPRIHKLFAEAWLSRAVSEPEVPKVAKGKLDPPFTPWNPTQDIAKFVASLADVPRGLSPAKPGFTTAPLDQSVPAVPGVEGGSVAGREVLNAFVSEKLGHYADGRNEPNSPDRTAASRLSPYLHFGHVSIQEVAEAVLGPKWTPKQINPKTRNKDDFFCRDASTNDFLDEAITWRDVGYHWNFMRIAAADARAAKNGGNVSWGAATTDMPRFNFATMDFSLGGENTLDLVLPDWARATLGKHARDRREHLYTLEEFEAAATHDELWNAAQKELVATGRIHNYMRMLWGKKVLEWTGSPAEAYCVLEHLNNKYALDGRDPNSYSGVLWCFGLFDRPWPPERKVFGTVRYMSSESAAKKFDLDGYHEYVAGLAPRPTRS